MQLQQKQVGTCGYIEAQEGGMGTELSLESDLQECWCGRLGVWACTLQGDPCSLFQGASPARRDTRGLQWDVGPSGTVQHTLLQCP